MIYIMMLAFIVSAFIERRRDSRRAILIYALINAAHTLLPTFENGLVYYGGSALTDLIIVTFLAWMCHGKLSRYLMGFSIASILINIGGFVLWLTYRPLDVYNIAMALLYALALLVIVSIGRYDEQRRTTDSDRGRNFHGHSGARSHHLHEKQK